MQKVLNFINPLTDIGQVTVEDLRESKELRDKLRNPNDIYISNPNYAETNKPDQSEIQNRLLAKESYEGSAQEAYTNKFFEIEQHNIDVSNEFTEGQEGIDYTIEEGVVGDARLANVDKIKRDLKSQINGMKINDPELGEYYDRLVKGLEEDYTEFVMPEGQNILDVVKFYPGSSKGMAPEDDPEFYTEWFMKN